MKKIDFKNILPPDGQSLKFDENRWRVIIGKTEISFTNQKNAITFQTKINEELNDALFIYNDISIELYRHYRTNWFYFNINQQQNINERKIREAFSEVERLMNKIIVEYENYRIIAYIAGIAECLKSIAKCLQSLQKHRESYAELRSLELMVTRINKCFDTIEGLGWNPLPNGGEIVRCEPLHELNIREQRKIMQETLIKRSLKG